MGALTSSVRRRRGLTLVEVMIASTLTVLLLGSFLQATQSGAAAYRRGSAHGALDSRAETAMNRILSELSATSLDRIVPNDPTAPFGTDTLRFDRPVAVNGTVTTWGDLLELRWELEPGEVDNGRDDDGDGLVDEGMAVLVRDPGGPDQIRTVLARAVSESLEGETQNAADDNGNGLEDEPGLCFELLDGVLVVRLTLEALGPDGELLVRTLEAGITPRN